MRRENGQPALRVRAYDLGFCTLGASFDRTDLAGSDSAWPGALDAVFDKFKIKSWRFLTLLGKKFKIYNVRDVHGLPQHLAYALIVLSSTPYKFEWQIQEIRTNSTRV